MALSNKDKTGSFIGTLFDPAHFLFSSRSERKQDAFNEAQLQLQREQFDYQKWYDKNNVNLALNQYMDNGINPLAAQGASSSAVVSSANPSMPSGQEDSSVLMGLLSTLVDNGQHSKEMDLAEKELSFRKEQEKNKVKYQNRFMQYLGGRLSNENVRTNSYKDLTEVQKDQLLNDLRHSLEAKYGRGSSYVKKVLGELDAFVRGADTSNNKYGDLREKPEEKPKPKQADEEYYEKKYRDDPRYLKYVEKVVRNEHRMPSVNEWLSTL